ncbi:hypothetical protein BFS06_12300 [Clostridium perfringens]|uniref:Uncharacterized protein n=1 Tax=Clostridium perfringens TaxID=1502 RepID=A0A140GR27_CLOPF|nr:hypothetical protein [Clostridium perfringens]AMN30986.1 hypothetical protein JFP838_pA0070 [Clostridium perfringens]TBX14982.1 hypothetical protein BFS06_12300 [Clostridium perfringens]
MNNKAIVRETKILRKILGFSNSIKLSKYLLEIGDRYYVDSLDFLKDLGCTSEMFIEGYCSADGGAKGYYLITVPKLDKNVRGGVFKIKFDCCGYCKVELA